MSDFDHVRPFHDHEVGAVIHRIVRDPELIRAAATLMMPGVLRGKRLGHWLTGVLLRHRTRRIKSVADCQRVVEGYYTKLIANTIEALEVEGLDQLDPAQPYLFVSNHRDITMDSGLLNYSIHHAGHVTCRSAVGNNLMEHSLASDLMRLNKSFIVERNVTGAKAMHKAMSLTSSYIRHSLEEGTSIWIAQREGRAKDGWDRTEPALLKMLALAYKSDDEEHPLERLVGDQRIVPVSISYEIDPCAPRKARELAALEAVGEYQKSRDEDLDSMILGMTGFKGRVHLRFHAPLVNSLAPGELTADDLAQSIDLQIVAGLKEYPTNVAAASCLCEERHDGGCAALEQQLAGLNERERHFLLLQYANVVHNRRELQVA